MKTPPKRTTIFLIGFHLFLSVLGYSQSIFNRSEIPIQKNGLNGLITTDGKTIFPPEYEVIEKLHSNEKIYYSLQKNSMAWLVDSAGKRIMDPVDAPLITSGWGNWAGYFQNGQYKAFHIPTRTTLPKGFPYLTISRHLATMGADSIWTAHFSPDSSQKLIKAEIIEVPNDHMFMVTRNGESWIQFWGSDIEFPYDSLINTVFDFSLICVLDNGEHQFLYFTKQHKLYGPYTECRTSYSSGAGKNERGWQVFSENGTPITQGYYADIWLDSKFTGLFNGETWQILDSYLNIFTQSIYTEHVEDDGLFSENSANYFTSADSTLCFLYDDRILHLSGKYELINWNDSLLVYRQNEKLGVLKTDGTRLTAPEYDEIELMGNETFNAITNGQPKIFHLENGALATRKKLLIQSQDLTYPERPWIQGQPNWDWDRPQSERKGWFWDSEKEKWGLKDPKTEKVLLPPTYTEVMTVPGREFTVIFDGIWGDEILMGIYNHQTQKMEVPPTGSNFDWDLFVRTGRTRYWVENGGWNIFEIGVGIIPFPGVSQILASTTGNYILNRGAKKVEREENEIITWDIPLNIEFIGGTYFEFVGGEYALENWGKNGIPVDGYSYLEETTDGYFIYQRKDDHGLIDLNNHRILEGYAALSSWGTYLWGDKLLDKVVVYDNNGKLLTPEPLDKIGTFHEGLAPAQKGGKWGYMDTLGRWVIQPKYTTATAFGNGRGCVTMDKSSLVLDKAGRVIFKVDGTPHAEYADGWIPMYHISGYAYYDVNGNKMQIEGLKSASRYSDGLAIVRTAEGYQVLTAKGKMVPMEPAPKMDWATGTGVIADYNGKLGWISPMGKFTAIPNATKILRATPSTCFYESGNDLFKIDEGGKPVKLEADKLKKFAEGRIPARKGNKWGYLDEKGNWAIPPQFDWAEEFRGGHAAVNVDGKYWVIDPKGKAGPLPPSPFCPVMGPKNYIQGLGPDEVIVSPDGSHSGRMWKLSSPIPLGNGNWIENGEGEWKIVGAKGEYLRTLPWSKNLQFYPQGIIFPVYYTQFLHSLDGKEIAQTWESQIQSDGINISFLKKGETAILGLNEIWIRPPKP